VTAPTVTEANGRRIVRFDDVRDFYTYGDSVEPTLKDKGQQSRTGDVSFTGSRDWEHAMQMSYEGWSEIRPEVMATVGKIDAQVRPLVETNLSLVHDVSGGAVDIDRYLTGEAECMIDSTLSPVARNGRVQRGIAVLALCELLRLAGLSLEVWCEDGAKTGEISCGILTRVLKAGDPIDVDSLMFPLAHPSMLRRFAFAVWERQPRKYVEGLHSWTGGSYGAPVEAVCADLVNADIALSERMQYGDETVEDPIGWVQRKLETLGVIQPS
jgi:hypothetical protein